MMRTLLLHLVLLVPALFVGAVEYEGYTNPAGTKFPIAIYDNVPISINRVQILSDAEQKAYFDSIRLAGFNVELWGKGDIWRKDLVNKWAPYLKSIGINTIISSRGHSLTRSKTPYDANTPDSILLEDNWEGLKTVITNYSQDPNVWGYWACDAPTPRNWGVPVYELNKNEVAVIPTFNRVNKYKGDKIAYANFVARSNETYIGHFATDNPDNSYVENFEDYLDYMVDLFKLKFLTFDLYPVISNYAGMNPKWIIKQDYYNMMDLYGRYCRDRKIPVWLVMLSVEHARYDKPGGELDWEYPEITEGLLRMQAMNGLAFGMKGIAYWQYGAQNNWSGNTLYKSALYDTNKKMTTPAWKAARAVNLEAIQYGSYLQHAIYDKSCLAADINALSGKTTTDTMSPFDEFAEFSNSFECIKGITYNGKGVLLSHLVSDSGDYLAIVNQDYAKEQKLTIVFDKTKRIKRIKIAYPVANNSIGTPEEFVPFTTTINLWPGEMALFKYPR